MTNEVNADNSIEAINMLDLINSDDGDGSVIDIARNAFLNIFKTHADGDKLSERKQADIISDVQNYVKNAVCNISYKIASNGHEVLHAYIETVGSTAKDDIKIVAKCRKTSNNWITAGALEDSVGIIITEAVDPELLQVKDPAQADPDQKDIEGEISVADAAFDGHGHDEVQGG